MKIYHSSAIIKLVFWLMIIVSSLRFIDPWIDPVSAILIMSVGIILALWWMWFYIYLLGLSFVSDKKYSYLASYAYKLSLLTWSYAAINWLLIWFEVWGWTIGILLLLCCIFIAALILDMITPYRAPESTTSTHENILD